MISASNIHWKIDRTSYLSINTYNTNDSMSYLAAYYHIEFFIMTIHIYLKLLSRSKAKRVLIMILNKYTLTYEKIQLIPYL